MGGWRWSTAKHDHQGTQSMQWTTLQRDARPLKNTGAPIEVKYVPFFACLRQGKLIGASTNRISDQKYQSRLQESPAYTIRHQSNSHNVLKYTRACLHTNRSQAHRRGHANLLIYCRDKIGVCRQLHEIGRASFIRNSLSHAKMKEMAM
jgi:hypothetical protein